MAGGGTSFAESNDAIKYLRPAVEEGFDYTGEMLVRMNSWVGEPQMMKIQTVKDKGVKVTWIHPSTVQGQAYLDDGKLIQQYIPDKKYIRVRPSFQTFWPSGKTMLALAEKNYTVKEIGRGTRAGRSAIVIEAKAKNSELGVRRITVDKEYPVVLEDIHTVGTKSINRIQTIEFRILPASEIKLSLGAPRDVRSDKAWGPVEVKDVKFAAGAVGFTPSLPTKIPLGFTVFVRQLVGTEKDPFFVARITDGLLVGHIYQWKYKRGAVKERSEIPVMMVDSRRDVAYSLLGDLPPEAADIILRAFVEAGR